MNPCAVPALFLWTCVVSALATGRADVAFGWAVPAALVSLVGINRRRLERLRNER